jgi:hypothetical protein
MGPTVSNDLSVVSYSHFRETLSDKKFSEKFILYIFSVTGSEHAKQCLKCYRIIYVVLSLDYKTKLILLDVRFSQTIMQGISSDL